MKCVAFLSKAGGKMNEIMNVAGWQDISFIIGHVAVCPVGNRLSSREKHMQYHHVFTRHLRPNMISFVISNRPLSQITSSVKHFKKTNETPNVGVSHTGSSSHLRTMLPQSSSWPQPAQWPNHAT